MICLNVEKFSAPQGKKELNEVSEEASPMAPTPEEEEECRTFAKQTVDKPIVHNS
jgi:hypothetical protein